MNPKVAIITRTYNRPSLLKRAIESVLNQTEKNWVHCIVNDGGDEAQLNTIVEPFVSRYDGRLLVINQLNSGMQVAANKGIKKTKSEFISIHDDDDTWASDYLQKMVSLLEKEGPESNYQGAIAQTLKITEKEEKDGSFSELKREKYVPLQEITLFRVGFENPFPPIAFTFRRSVCELIGTFDPRWDVVSDLDFNIRFLQKFDIAVIKEPLVFYHWREPSQTGTSANSVSKSQEKHRRLLFELKNHYLRNASSLSDLASGLSLQLSQYLLEDEWLTAEIREKQKESFTQLQTLNKQLEEVRRFQQEITWPKLSLLQERTENYKREIELIDGISRFQHESAWPVLSEIGSRQKECINLLTPLLKNSEVLLSNIVEASLSNNEQSKLLHDIKKFQRESEWHKLEEIYEHLIHLKESSINKLSLLDKLKVSLDSVLINQDQIISKIAPVELLEKWDSANATTREQISKLVHKVENLRELIEDINQFQKEHKLPRLETISASIDRLNTVSDKTEINSTALFEKLHTLEENQKAMAEVIREQTLFSVGRFQFKWKKRQQP